MEDISKGNSLKEYISKHFDNINTLSGEIIDIIGTASHFNTIFGDILLIGLPVQINDWSTLQAGDDISEAHFFDINHLPELAFDSHKELIEIFKKTL